MNIPLTGLTGGEFTPHLDARTDTEKYPSGCRHLENMLPLKYGDTTRRSGTKFIVNTIDLDTILSSLVVYENVIVDYENKVVSTLADTATNNVLMPVFVSFENLIMCYENKIVVESQTAVLSENIVCCENTPVFYENQIVVK